MAMERRYKPLGQGLPGKANFKVPDLSDGNIIEWDATAGKWVVSTQFKSDGNKARLLFGDDNVLSTQRDTANFSGTQVLIEDTTGDDTAWILLKSGVAGASGGGVITHFGDDLFVDNRRDGGRWIARVQDNTNTARNVLVADPSDGSVAIYYQGAKTLGTQAGGASVQDDNGSNPTLDFFQDDGTTKNAEIFAGSASGLLVRNRAHGTPIELRAEDAGGTEQTLLSGDPDGAVDLYYDGSRRFRTGPDFVIDAPDTDFIVRDTTDAVNNFIWRDHSAGILYLGTENAAEIKCRSGVEVGDPTGGNKGAGTLNAEAIYDDNSLLTDYVFDAELEGDVDTAKWDAAVPDKRRPVMDENGNAHGEVITPRKHEPAHSFKKRQDDLDPKAFAAKWRRDRKLPAFVRKGRAESGALSLGEQAQRLLETCEVQAVHIDKLLARIEALEEARNGGHDSPAPEPRPAGPAKDGA